MGRVGNKSHECNVAFDVDGTAILGVVKVATIPSSGNLGRNSLDALRSLLHSWVYAVDVLSIVFERPDSSIFDTMWDKSSSESSASREASSNESGVSPLLP